MKTLKKRIPHLNLLDILPNEIDGYALREFIEDNYNELCELDDMPCIQGRELYYDTSFVGKVFMLTPTHCKYITQILSKDFDDVEVDDNE